MPRAPHGLLLLVYPLAAHVLTLFDHVVLLYVLQIFFLIVFWEARGHESCCPSASTHLTLSLLQSKLPCRFLSCLSVPYISCCWLFMCMNIMSKCSNFCCVYGWGGVGWDWLRFGIWTAMVVSFICICTCTSSLSDQLKGHT